MLLLACRRCRRTGSKGSPGGRLIVTDGELLAEHVSHIVDFADLVVNDAFAIALELMVVDVRFDLAIQTRVKCCVMVITEELKKCLFELGTSRGLLQGLD